MESVQRYTVLLASPSDVMAERGTARDVLNEVNRLVGREKGAILDLVGWETDTFPAVGTDPQALINSQLPAPDECDLFIGIMWNRFGSPTPRANSGTEEEFLRAIDSLKKHGRPDIMFFFNTAPSRLETKAEIDQRGKLIDFRGTYQSIGLYASYEGVANFEKHFRQAIHHWLAQRTMKPVELPADSHRNASSADQSAAPGPGVNRHVPVEWLLLDSRFYHARSVKEHGDGRTETHILPEDAEDDAALRALRPGDYHRSQIVSYAYENDGFLARISKVERESAQDEKVWKIELEPAKERESGMFDQVSYNGLTPDKMATMRARLILLSETPIESKGIQDTLLCSFVRGGHGSAVEVPESGIFHELRRKFEGDEKTFLEIARLWAVFFLRASNTCEHVLQLTLGPIRANSMPVKFRGRRHQIYSNKKPEEIEVEGACELPRR